jgi:hypothetical protein
MSRIAYVAVVIVLAAPAPAAAASAQPSPELCQLCEADYHRLCPTIVPGGGRILKCLLDNDKDLSTKCRAALQQLNK